MNPETLEQEERSLKIKQRVDAMGDYEFFAALVSFFGFPRAVELCGWAFVLGVVSPVTGRDVATMRRSMEERGQTSSAFYRSLADIRVFASHLIGEPIPPRQYTETRPVLDRLAAMRPA